jgi:hypothetical protein
MTDSDDRKQVTGQECRVNAAECEIRAVKTNDLELREYYTRMAKDWWYLAGQIESLEAEFACSAAMLLSENEARRIAANVAKLPDLLPANAPDTPLAAKP